MAIHKILLYHLYNIDNLGRTSSSYTHKNKNNNNNDNNNNSNNNDNNEPAAITMAIIRKQINITLAKFFFVYSYNTSKMSL